MSTDSIVTNRQGPPLRVVAKHGHIRAVATASRLQLFDSRPESRHVYPSLYPALPALDNSKENLFTTVIDSRFSSDGRRLAVFGGATLTVRVHTFGPKQRTLQKLWTGGGVGAAGDQSVKWASFLPGAAGSSYLLVAKSGSLEIHRVGWHLDPVTRAPPLFTVKIAPKLESLLRPLGGSAFFDQFAISPDGTFLVTSVRGGVIAYWHLHCDAERAAAIPPDEYDDITIGAARQTLEQEQQRCPYGIELHCVAVCDQNILVIEPNRPNWVAQLTNTSSLSNRRVTCEIANIAISSDARQIFTLLSTRNASTGQKSWGITVIDSDRIRHQQAPLQCDPPQHQEGQKLTDWYVHPGTKRIVVGQKLFDTYYRTELVPLRGSAGGGGCITLFADSDRFLTAPGVNDAIRNDSLTSFGEYSPSVNVHAVHTSLCCPEATPSAGLSMPAASSMAYLPDGAVGGRPGREFLYVASFDPVLELVDVSGAVPSVVKRHAAFTQNSGGGLSICPMMKSSEDDDDESAFWILSRSPVREPSLAFGTRELVSNTFFASGSIVAMRFEDCSSRSSSSSDKEKQSSVFVVCSVVREDGTKLEEKFSFTI